MESSINSAVRPDTYFVQQAIARGLAAIAARLDKDAAYRPYFLVQFAPEPEMQHHIWDLGDMCSRYVDAAILARQVTGQGLPNEIDAALRNILFTCDPYLEPFMATRVMIALVDVYLQEPTAANRQRIEALVALVRTKMTFEHDYAYYFKQAPRWTSQTQELGHFIPYPTYPIGGLIVGLARYLETEELPAARDLLDRLCKFVLDVSGTFDEQGHYKGHTHSGGILTAIAGILRWAINRNDTEVIQRMQNASDHTLKYSSSWGWVPDGLGQETGACCETCTLQDALHAAILLGRHVDAKYYNFVERCVRNQLLENQILKPELLLGDKQDTQVAQALYGSWASHALPNSLDSATTSVEGCCLGAGIRALCLAWEAAIEKQGATVSVNLAISRNSPWCEVIGYQPYQGRIDIIRHDDSPIQVRLPAWVNSEAVRVCRKGQPLACELTQQHYVMLGAGPAGEQISIMYPLRQIEISETVNQVEYRVRWRGDTVVGIEPQGVRYPLFERAFLNRDNAPELDHPPYLEQTGGPVRW
jgi:hypothetical protein